MHRRNLAGMWKAGAVTAVLIACSVAAGAQTTKTAPPPKQKVATTSPAPAKPASGMLSGQSTGTLLQSPKANPGTPLSPSLLANADVEHMSHAQFRALADAAVVRYRGQSMSKAAFIQQRLKEWGARPGLAGHKPSLSFEEVKTQFQKKQASTLEAENARVQAVIDRFNQKLRQVQGSSQYSALLAEARALQQRYKSASPAEQSRLKTRALEIHQELARLERAE
ncbi:MAG: hypothetical protein LAO03_11790 [Acidobacteriia bacterium]|nr:hypothetical protein [Terriglobia bacterium]